jgi:hypothetical protein
MTAPLTPLEFCKALVSAGVFTEDDIIGIRRLVIVVDPEMLVTMHVERIGDEKLIDLAALLTRAEVEREPQPDSTP